MLILNAALLIHSLLAPSSAFSPALNSKKARPILKTCLYSLPIHYEDKLGGILERYLDHGEVRGGPYAGESISTKNLRNIKRLPEETRSEIKNMGFTGKDCEYIAQVRHNGKFGILEFSKNSIRNINYLIEVFKVISVDDARNALKDSALGNALDHVLMEKPEVSKFFEQFNFDVAHAAVELELDQPAEWRDEFGMVYHTNRIVFSVEGMSNLDQFDIMLALKEGALAIGYTAFTFDERANGVLRSHHPVTRFKLDMSREEMANFADIYLETAEAHGVDQNYNILNRSCGTEILKKLSEARFKDAHPMQTPLHEFAWRSPAHSIPALTKMGFLKENPDASLDQDWGQRVFQNFDESHALPTLEQAYLYDWIYGEGKLLDSHL